MCASSGKGKKRSNMEYAFNKCRNIDNSEETYTANPTQSILNLHSLPHPQPVKYTLRFQKFPEHLGEIWV